MLSSSDQPPVTLITGASRGIGLAIAERLVADGHEVIHLSRSRARGCPGMWYAVDLSDEVATERVLAEVTQRHRIDNLVNNAAAVSVSGIDDLSWPDLRRLIELNVRAVLQCIQAVTPQMRQRRHGRIVNLGSRAALGKTHRTLYGMTKAGVIGLSRSLALELAPDGITLNAVSPGPIETEMFRQNSKADDPAVQHLTRSIPVGRMGRPEDVAAAVAFFLQADAGFITGQNLYVCGGLSLGAASI